MKSIFTCIVCWTIWLLPAQAQRLIFNEKAPQLQITEYLFGETLKTGQATYVEFFVPEHQADKEYFDQLEHFAAQYKDRINFIVIAKGDKEKIKQFFAEKKPSYRVAYDNQGKTFSDFGIQYLPAAIIIDAKGKFVWQGKASLLEDKLLNKY